MLYDLQRISGGLIIYSVLVSDFEKLDFKNDALAGVRANFFNSNHNPQSDKTELQSGDQTFALSYSMKYGEPLLWKVTSDNNPCQTVKRVSNDVYCVLGYNANGVINKRLYFDNFHNFLTAEYYDNERENVLLANLKPVIFQKVVCLRYDTVNENGEKTSQILYPSTSQKGKKCACLLYTNIGMLWYDSSFKPADMADPEAEKESGKGFSFTVEDFTKPAAKPLDLMNADYLTEADFAREEEPAEEAVPEKIEYSAYDKIESILFEAHKTNKNIFGEVASYAEKEEPEEQTAEESEEVAEEVNEEVIEEPVSVTSEDNKKPEFEQKEAPKPDTVIKTKNGDYSYYGKLDDNGQRTGVGRIASPDGITVYEGSYSLDKREGFGISYYKDGKPNYVGQWTSGNRSGCGVGYRRSDGTMHVGNWLDNSPNGTGARFTSDGLFLDICSYKEGVREGKSISFDENGNVVITVYIAGEAVAEKVITDEDIFPQRDVASNPPI